MAISSIEKRPGLTLLWGNRLIQKDFRNKIKMIIQGINVSPVINGNGRN
jgi:hypothetical protein